MRDGNIIINESISNMNYRHDTITFPFGEFTAIEMLHCVQRELQRGNLLSNDLFGMKGVKIKPALVECFKVLERDHYNSIVTDWKADKAIGMKSVWVIGFQTDELERQKGKPLFLYVVFSISPKETAMNGVQLGEDAVCIMTVLKDSYKKARAAQQDTIERNLCYFKDSQGQYAWRTGLKC